MAPTAPSPSLTELAAESFADLAVGEVKLVEWLSAPQRPNSRLDLGYTLDNVSGTRESESELPPRDCVIRAHLIEWLCREIQPRTLIARTGILIDRAVIAGRLTLSFVDVPFPLAFYRCELAGGIELLNANLLTIGLDGCRVAEIQAASVMVRGSVYLRRGFRCQGGASFIAATIAGDLSCDAAAFERTDGFGLDLDRAKISRSVFLRNGFRAPGGVRLVRACVGLDLDCERGEFGHQDAGFGVDAYLAKVGGSVRLNAGFVARGQVFFRRAEIGGDVLCDGGDFRSASGRISLSLEGATVQGDVFLRTGFVSTGEVNLQSASVRGALDLTGARFAGDDSNGLSVLLGEVKGVLTWSGVKTTTATFLDLRQSSVGFLVDDQKSWPASNHLRIAGFRYGGLSYHVSSGDRLRWLTLQRNYRAQPYRQLARFLQERGDEADARRVLMAAEEARYKKGGLGRLERVGNRLLKYTVGFGYIPRRALYWMAALILVGTLVFAGGDGKAFLPTDLSIQKDTAFRVHGSTPSGYARFNAFAYSVDTSLPIIDFGQEKRWYPDASRTCRGLVDNWDILCGRLTEWYLWTHIALGWLFTTVGVAAVTGLVRKD